MISALPARTVEPLMLQHDGGSGVGADVQDKMVEDRGLTARAEDVHDHRLVQLCAGWHRKDPGLLERVPGLGCDTVVGDVDRAQARIIAPHQVHHDLRRRLNLHPRATAGHECAVVQAPQPFYRREPPCFLPAGRHRMISEVEGAGRVQPAGHLLAALHRIGYPCGSLIKQGHVERSLSGSVW